MFALGRCKHTAMFGIEQASGIRSGVVFRKKIVVALRSCVYYFIFVKVIVEIPMSNLLFLTI